MGTAINYDAMVVKVPTDKGIGGAGVLRTKASAVA